MAQSLEQISWSEPLFPPRVDPLFEADFKARFGSDVPEIYRLIADVPWMREAGIKLERMPRVVISQRMVDIGTMVTAQENACRYCYGATRAYMRTLGYSERMISQIEREVQIAGLDEMERSFVRFCRNLARSRPRPSREDREALLRQGFSPLAVAEMASLITGQSIMNRVATFIAAPPLHEFERRANSLPVRLLRPLLAIRPRFHPRIELTPVPDPAPHFPQIIAALAGLPMASVLHEALEGAFAPSRISQPVKLLMFAVVALSLGCGYCEAQARGRLLDDGFDPDELDDCLASLRSPRLTEEEEALLAWTRKTVHFETGAIQRQTRELAEHVEPAVVQEAIGLAALANSVVRLAVLLDG